MFLYLFFFNWLRLEGPSGLGFHVTTKMSSEISDVKKVISNFLHDVMTEQSDMRFVVHTKPMFIDVRVA